MKIKKKFIFLHILKTEFLTKNTKILFNSYANFYLKKIPI